jgi:acetylornithine aminotransferase
MQLHRAAAPRAPRAPGARPAPPAPRAARGPRPAAAVAAERAAPGAAKGDAAEATARVVEEEAQYVLQTYARPADVVFVRGEGAKLYDAAGKEYLDMAAGGWVGVGGCGV